MAKRVLTPEQRLENAARAKKWREEHPGYMKTYMKGYREENGDKLRENDRQYHAAHREENNLKRREWARKYPERERAASDRWIKANPGRVLDNYLKRTYGITKEEYDRMFSAQGGVCKICGGGSVGRGRLHVDHDHKTDRVRGLLCHHCNVFIGSAQESIEVLQAAQDYLRGPEPDPDYVI